MGESDSKAVQLVLGDRARDDAGDTDSESSDDEGGEVRMTDEDRRTLRRKIREMMDRQRRIQRPGWGAPPNSN